MYVRTSVLSFIDATLARLQLQIRKAHGCYILDVVYKATFSGVVQVQEAMKT